MKGTPVPSHTAGETSASAVALLRNEPVQARSTARLTSLLDAAAAVVDEIGYERLTTAMIAERAGSSIGTVYRYFPDRIAVLHALSGRSMSRFMTEGLPLIEAEGISTWTDAVGAALDYWVDAYRSEPGFRALRFGDVLDLRPRIGDLTNNGVVASAILAVLTRSHGVDGGEESQFRLEVALELADSLLARAFAFDLAGNARFIDEARENATVYLERFMGNQRGES
ncbi:MAG: TetR/AcrR family transcriptional regulator [Burkholderiaceae bacterium]|nr:TetR/AcrR family transcriptional regulator [Microbacteriaceae bacterium]